MPNAPAELLEGFSVIVGPQREFCEEEIQGPRDEITRLRYADLDE